MIKPDHRVLTVLARLRSETDLLDWLHASLEAYRDDAVMQRDETTLRIVQGNAQVLRKILSLIDESPALLDNSRRA